MKISLQPYILFIALVLSATAAFADGGKASDQTQRISETIDDGFPFPFSEFGSVDTPDEAAVSTGYYFVDSDDEAGDQWRPIPEIIDTTTDRAHWHRIMPGPRMLNGSDGSCRAYWEENTEEGLRFFRNPALPAFPDERRNFFVNGPTEADVAANATDSTDDAIAGPIPLGFDFYFNGLRCDSFYVSTNGIICLTNRRYYYDSNGERTIPAGSDDAYDPMSADWFEDADSRSYRDHSGSGLSDPIDDDYGYKYSVCGGDPTNRHGGLRKRVESESDKAALTNIAYKAAVIAPFWGDMQLSQYDKAKDTTNDWGRVWYKRTEDNDKLTIYIINISPVRTKYNILSQDYDAPVDARLGASNYTSATAQIILDPGDSSVTIIYERFDGTAVIEGRGYPASTIFRSNACSGVRGFARHVDYGRSGGASYPWAGEYEQCTHYFNNLRNAKVIYPHNYLAIRFKQWKNVLRAVAIQYRVRSQAPGADLDFAPEGCDDCLIPSSKIDGYEIMAGEPKLAAIQPVGIFQNMSNEIQGPDGVNFQEQEMKFQARLRIVNIVTGRIVYNRLVPIDSLCLDLPDSLSQNCTGNPNVQVRCVQVSKDGGDYVTAEYDPFLPYKSPGVKYSGVRPYGFVRVYFPPFEISESNDDHIGLLRAYLIAIPEHPNYGYGFGDKWPFDDTLSSVLAAMRRLEQFSDFVNEFHIFDRAPIPSLNKWVTIGAEIASGDQVSHHPLPPRGDYAAANNENYTLGSPVIRMNRKHRNGFDPSTGPSDYQGDQIRSFPIDMREKYGSLLSVSFQRTNSRDDWPRGWCDQKLIGPEPRSFLNGSDLSLFGRTDGQWPAAASYYPDWIEVQFLAPSPDGVQYLTNVPDERWQIHPRRGGAPPVTTMPAYKLWGSNGYSVGFLETDPDSSLEPASRYSKNGFRPNIYDDGIDYEFQKASIAIPDTFIRAANEGAKNFRFRIRVRASNDRKCAACIPDDDDPFYVDNVTITAPSEDFDLAAQSIKLIWPYTMVPASQAMNMRIKVKVANISTAFAPAFWIKLEIFSTRKRWEPYYAVYCRTEALPFLPPLTEVEIPMPRWDARAAGRGSYGLRAIICVPGGDIFRGNDTTYTIVDLRFGDAFAYDPIDKPRNDVPDMQFTGILGRGLNLRGYSHGGTGSVTSYQPSSYDNDTHGAGYRGGSGFGSIAMKFEVNEGDTIYGYQTYWGISCCRLDDIIFAIYNDYEGERPREIIDGSLKYSIRCWDDIRNDLCFGKYVTTLLEEPLYLPRGVYWASLSQVGGTGLELGASKSRMGMRTTNVYVAPPVGVEGDLGKYGNSLMIDKNFRKNSGGNLVNNNLFCYQNARAGEWKPFMPTTGNPGYAHLGHFGCVDGDKTATLSRGGWIPMIRPYFKVRRSGYDSSYHPCKDDRIPVELLSFNAFVRKDGVDLVWETATEIGSYGFYIEKTIVRKAENADWETIGFVKGAGDSKSLNSYSFFDEKVRAGLVYQYRLRQVDLDGTQACYPSRLIEIAFSAADLALRQSWPNPFASSSNIAFNLPEKMSVRLEIIDLYGEVVKTLIDDVLPAQEHTVKWYGDDRSGAAAANGTYIYRLKAGGKVLSGKMTLIR